MHWLGGRDDVAAAARTYLSTSLRGLQDTRTPLLVAVVAAAGNAVLNVVLVYGAGLGIAGPAPARCSRRRRRPRPSPWSSYAVRAGDAWLVTGAGLPVRTRDTQ